MHNAQCTIVERALRAYLDRDEITGFCLRIDADLVLIYVPARFLSCGSFFISELSA